MTDELQAPPDMPGVVLAKERTLDGVLGIELVEVSEERCRGRLEVSDSARQPYGIVHGGAYAALAESIVSATTAWAVMKDGNIAVGQSNTTNFLRPASEGTIHAEAIRRHRGRTSWVWDVECTDDDGRLCAISRVTMAVRPMPGG